MIEELRKMIGESTEVEDTIALVVAYWRVNSNEFESAYNHLDDHEIKGDPAWFLHACDLIEPYTRDAIISDLRIYCREIDCDKWTMYFHMLHSALDDYCQGQKARTWSTLRQITDQMENNDPWYQKLTAMENRIRGRYVV